MARIFSLSSAFMFIMMSNFMFCQAEDLNKPENFKAEDEKNPFMHYVQAMISWTEKKPKDAADKERYKGRVEAQKEMMIKDYEEQAEEFKRRIAQAEQAILTVQGIIEKEKKNNADVAKYEQQIKGIEDTIASLKEKAADIDAKYAQANAKIPGKKAKKKK